MPSNSRISFTEAECQKKMLLSLFRAHKCTSAAEMLCGLSRLPLSKSVTALQYIVGTLCRPFRLSKAHRNHTRKVACLLEVSNLDILSCPQSCPSRKCPEVHALLLLALVRLPSQSFPLAYLYAQLAVHTRLGVDMRIHWDCKC
jgi:hypothetical protein